MVVKQDDILTVIPQRFPFIMIDELLYSDDRLTCSRFRISEENIFVEDGELKEPGLVENMAQTAAARAGHLSRSQNKPVTLGYIGSINKLEIFSLPAVNDVLETEVEVLNQVFNATMISGKVRCKEKIIAACEMKIFIINQINQS